LGNQPIAEGMQGQGRESKDGDLRSGNGEGRNVKKGSVIKKLDEDFGELSNQKTL